MDNSHGFPVPQATRKPVRILNPTEKLLIVFWGILAAISLLFASRIPAWRSILAGNLIAAGVVCALACFAHSKNAGALRWIRDWSAFPLVVFTFKQVYFIIGPLHQGKDYDSLLILIDRWLFRTNPTQWLARWSHPLLTEILQIAYSLFYVLFIAIGLELYLKKEYRRFRFFRFTIVYGFFLSYLAYFLLPAVGPRFTLHDFSRTDTELPGLLFTPALRWFVNIFESIPPRVANGIALVNAQRDVFPSGHTMMTLAAIVFAWKWHLALRYYVVIIGILLLFSTVYLRYHYVVDVLAGALLVIPCLCSSKTIYTRLGGPGEK
jgi:membrane-associated phospholipid phosphatase